MSVYVGIDVHRKRSQVAVVTEEGTVRVNRNVPNGVAPILKVIGDLPTGTPVAFEAAYGWGWLVELLEDDGFDPHLVHPLRCKAIASARLNNDKVDAAILAQLLRADLLPEAWIAPKEVRELRALLGHRVALVRLCTGLRNRIHAVVARPRPRPTRRLLDRRLLDRAGTGLAFPGCPYRRYPGGSSPTASRSSTPSPPPSSNWTARCTRGRRLTRGSRC